MNKVKYIYLIVAEHRYMRIICKNPNKQKKATKTMKLAAAMPLEGVIALKIKYFQNLWLM